MGFQFKVFETNTRAVDYNVDTNPQARKPFLTCTLGEQFSFMWLGAMFESGIQF